MSRVNEKRVDENDRKRHVKISKVEFRFFFNFPQYSNSCQEYFSGEEFKVGKFLSAVPIQKNYWIDQIWTKFASCSEMVFFFPCIMYISKVSSLGNVRADGRVLAIIFYYLAFWEAIYVYGLPHGWFRPIVLNELLFFTRTRSNFFLPVTILYNRTPEIG